MLIPIAKCMGIELNIDQQGFLSFTNSPFYSHRQLESIDIYPGRGVKEAYSPVEGEVIEARKLKVMEDYYIAIKAGSSEACVKILHAKPFVEKGDYVLPGDIIGNLAWSPFFDFWTDPHLHVEVRPIDDRLRARGAYILDPTPLLENYEFEMKTPDKFLVEEVFDRYILLAPTTKIPSFTTPLITNIFGISLIIEGGLKHYGHAALCTNPRKITQKALQYLQKKFKIDYINQGYIHFKFENMKTNVNGCHYKGMSLYLNDPHIKLIPISPGESELMVGDELLFTDIMPF